MKMIELRNYQLDAIEQLRANIRAGIKSQILCAPTGAGKSIITANMIQSALGKGKKILFLVDRRVLVNQFSAHLDNLDIPHGVIMAKHPRYMPSQKVQVASCQTLEKYQYLDKYDAIFYDEAHINRGIIKKLTEILPNCNLIGMTATPLTNGLGRVYQEIVNVTTMDKLVKEKFLVPFRVFIAHEVETDGVKVVAGEFKQSEIEERSIKIVGDVVSDYLQISNSVWGSQKKTIVFCAGVNHGKELCDAFNAIGKSFVDINYHHDEEYKAEVIKEFSKPDSSIDGLISCDILTRGFDVTDVEHIILARPLRKSLSQHIQMVGRGARIHAGKEFCVVQCNSGNYLRFKDDFDEIYFNGVSELNDNKEKTKKEPSKKAKADKTCPKCMALWPANSNLCHTCGYVRQAVSNVDYVDGEIAELNNVIQRKEITGEQKENFYRELLGYANKNGYKEGWAYHKYQERFGVKPCWKKRLSNPSPETIAFIRHLNIKNAKKLNRPDFKSMKESI